MADGTIEGLRRGAVETYWDAQKQHCYGTLCYDSHTGRWRLGAVSMCEDSIESTPTRLVLREELLGGETMKIIVPDAIDGKTRNLTKEATDMGIAHICPCYRGPKGRMEYSHSLFIFQGGAL